MKTDNIYAKGPLCECFGNTPELRVLMFFIAHPSYDYTKGEVAKNTNMSRQTVYRAIDKLKKFGLIEVTRHIGNTKLLHMTTSETTDAIILVNNLLVDVIVSEEGKKKIPTVKMSDDELREAMRMNQ